MELTEEQLERIRDYVAALRSGEYEQTTWRLGKVMSDGGKAYCCEGVAFERYHEQFKKFNTQWRATSDDVGACLFALEPEAEDSRWQKGTYNTAPTNFWRAMGMLSTRSTASDFEFQLPSGQTLLDGAEETHFDRIGFAVLNDEGFTFSQIADLIEWQFLPPRSGDGDE